MLMCNLIIKVDRDENVNTKDRFNGESRKEMSFNPQAQAPATSNSLGESSA